MSFADRIRNIINGTNNDPLNRLGSEYGVVNESTAKVQERCDGILHQTILTCTATPISVADDAGQSQYGGVKLYTFPEGMVVTNCCMIDGGITLVSGTIIAAFTGAIALGSAVASATGAPTLVTTAATWLQSTAMATASGGVNTCDAFSIATQITESGGRVYNGTSTAGPVWLNIKIADDNTHTAAVMSFTGTVVITWMKSGDL